MSRVLAPNTLDGGRRGLIVTPNRPIRGLADADEFKDARSAHVGGFNAAFADGSVKCLKISIAPQTLQALVTRNGDETVVGDSF